MQVKNKKKINENGSPGPVTPGPGDKWASGRSQVAAGVKGRAVGEGLEGRHPLPGTEGVL